MKVKNFESSYLKTMSNGTKRPIFIHSIDAEDKVLKELIDNTNLPVIKGDNGEALCFLSEEYPSGTQLKITKNGRSIYAVTKLYASRLQKHIDRMEAAKVLGYNPVTGEELA